MSGDGPIYTPSMLETAVSLFADRDVWSTYAGVGGTLTVEFPSSRRREDGRLRTIYRTTEDGCNCPGFTYHHGICSHVLAVKMYVSQGRARGRMRRPREGRTDA